jgi:hypothetical protein
VFNQSLYRDKKFVGVFVRFSPSVANSFRIQFFLKKTFEKDIKGFKIFVGIDNVVLLLFILLLNPYFKI